MDFEQFKENLTKDVKACFDDRTGADSSVDVHKVDKMNYSYEAMVVKPEGSDVGVSIDVNNLYEAYQNGTSYEQIVAGATESAEHYLNDKPDFNIDALKDYSQMKDKLSMDVVSSERNAELLEKVPHKNMLYTALIGYIHYEAQKEEQNFKTLLEMINAMEVREDDENFKNAIDLLFEELEEREPEHFAVRQYKKYKLAAGVATCN